MEQGHLKKTFFLAGLFNNDSLQVKAHTSIDDVLQSFKRNNSKSLF